MEFTEYVSRLRVVPIVKYIEKTTRVGGLEIKTSRGHMYLSHEPVRASAMSTWVRVMCLFPDQSRVLVLFLFHVNLLNICLTFIKYLL